MLSNLHYKNAIIFIQAIFGKSMTLNTSISRPKAMDRSKVVYALNKSSGPAENVRQLAKNIFNMATESVKGNTNSYF